MHTVLGRGLLAIGMGLALLGCAADEPPTDDPASGSDTDAPVAVAPSEDEGEEGDATSADDAAAEEDAAASAPTAQPPILSAWRLSEDGATAAHIEEDDGSPSPVEIQAVELETVDGVDYVRVETSGLPTYRTEITAELIEALDARPKAATDFRTGATTAEEGQRIDFGADIGFDSTGCREDEGGFGYWPPGPRCPGDQGVTAYFPLQPEPATRRCHTGLDTIGMWLNGVSMYNWWDSFSYQDEGVWNNIANVAEQYDVDVCHGHAAGIDYHHHGYPPCLAEQLGDEGDGHSPLYGFAADGYPVYGPWEAEGVLAASCWKKRDYEDPDSPTGCGVPGERGCVMVDPLDPSLGTEPAQAAGPRTDEVVTTLSGNQLVAASGYYFEDYYYDAACAAEDEARLDEHNGHSDEERGYHYHVSMTLTEDGGLASAFPYHIGPIFRGELRENSFADCGADYAVQRPGDPPDLGPPGQGAP